MECLSLDLIEHSRKGGPGGVRTHRLPILRRAHVPILLRGFWPAREELNLQRAGLQPAALPLGLRAGKIYDNWSGREDSNLRTPGSKPGSEPDPPPPRQIQEPLPGPGWERQTPSLERRRLNRPLVPRTGIEPVVHQGENLATIPMKSTGALGGTGGDRTRILYLDRVAAFPLRTRYRIRTAAISCLTASGP